MVDEVGARLRLELAVRAGSAVELSPTMISTAVAAALNVAGAGVTVLATGHNSSGGLRLPVGASSGEVVAAEKIQATLGDGPCLASARWREPMVVEQAELAQLWPIYYEQLVEQTSLRSVLAIPLANRHGVFGALDIYASRSSFAGLPSPSVVNEQIGQLVGRILLGTATGLDDHDVDEVPGVDPGRSGGEPRPPYRTRLDVWTAVGIMMSATGCGSADALALLRGYAFAHDLTLDDLGQRLIIGDLHPDTVLATEP